MYLGCLTSVSQAAAPVFKYLWVVDDVTLCEKYWQEVCADANTSAVSGKFFYDDKEWQLKLRTDTGSNRSATYAVSLHLHRANSPKTFLMRTKFYIVNNLGKKICQREYSSTISDQEQTSVWLSAPLEGEWLKNVEADVLWADGRLHMLVELQALGDQVVFPVAYIDTPPNNIIQDMSELLETGEFSDVVLNVISENNVFPEIQISVHSLILSKRSPVFAAMFAHDFAEKKNKVVTIVDASSATVRDMLQFIYTGSVKPALTFDRAWELLPCADRYDLSSLKIMCEQVLSRGLTCDNAAEVVSVAQLYKCNHLFELAWTFLVSNARAVMSKLKSEAQIEGEMPELINRLRITSDNVANNTHEE